MIEMKGIATYDGSFFNKDETRAKQPGQSGQYGEFDRLLGEMTGEETNTQTAADKTDTEPIADMVTPDVEIVTYTFTGQTRPSEFAYGFHVNVLV